VIRRMRPSDQKGVDLVCKECFSYGEGRALSRATASWVAVAGEGVVAFACARAIPAQATAYLSLSAVIRPWRGQGLQLRLVRARLAWARKEGLLWAVTYTAEKNLPSANSLIRAGFRLYQPAQPWGLPHALYFRRHL
jgi:GNAT superfamily N-acetyltransferase